MDTTNFMKTPKSTERTEKCFVGKGVFVTKDTSIPVNAISMIHVTEPPIISLKSAIVFGIVGLLLLFFKGTLAKGFGVLLIIMAIALAGLIYFLNMNRIFSLRIQSHSGFMVTIQSKELEFIRELREKFLECINDSSKVTYIDASQHIINQNAGTIDMRKIYGDHQEIKGNTIGGNFNAVNGQATVNTVYIDGNNNEGYVKQKASSVKNGLTDQQWEQLSKYFAEQSRTNQKFQDACISLSQYAKKQDTAGIKGFMKKLGSKTMTEIISTATGEILSILKILLTK